MSHSKIQILIIEDEVDIAELLQYNLKQKGYKTSIAHNGERGLEKARSQNPDLILLDLMLPGIHGLDVCRILKADPEIKNTPIVMLTALGQEESIVKGLEVGADDYVTKPFSFKILMARVKTIIRRSQYGEEEKEKDIKIHGLEIKPRSREVFINKVHTELTFTEFQILQLLASHPGWVFTRYQIIDKIRGDSYPVTDRSIDFQIVGLRKKMGESGSLIQTIRGVGYRFKNTES